MAPSRNAYPHTQQHPHLHPNPTFGIQLIYAAVNAVLLFLAPKSPPKKAFRPKAHMRVLS